MFGEREREREREREKEREREIYTLCFTLVFLVFMNAVIRLLSDRDDAALWCI